MTSKRSFPTFFVLFDEVLQKLSEESTPKRLKLSFDQINEANFNDLSPDEKYFVVSYIMNMIVPLVKSEEISKREPKRELSRANVLSKFSSKKIDNTLMKHSFTSKKNVILNLSKASSRNMLTDSRFEISSKMSLF